MAGGVSFRIWAPQRHRVAVVLELPQSRTVELAPEGNGYFSGLAEETSGGALYRLRLDADSFLYPDPASRFQPSGPHGPSQVVDHSTFEWTDSGWRGCHLAGQVLMELHIGTFTPEGTWSSAAERLADLQEVGITCVEVMPVADFAGEFGWGYDGVNFFAPTRLYGTPNDFRRFVDKAHSLGLGVILDVVYNHFGPDGNYIHAFSKDYFTDRHKTDWGEAVNYDDCNSAGVREFVATNAAYWIDEFHLDGLRLDATQNIYDSSPRHIVAELAAAARKAAAGHRSIIVVAENEEQKICHVQKPDEGGYGLDALWNDDFHHTAVVALTGHSEAYYSDYMGTPQEFVSAIKWGYLYQGQWYQWQKNRRGTSSLTTDPPAFVTFLENHDQVANSGKGQRVHQMANPGQYRALTALFLLSPGTPMLFQGQEFAASSPFFYFAEHRPDLAQLVAKGRKEFMAQFPSLASSEMQKRIPNPAARLTFEQSRVDWKDRERHREALALHRDLIRLRKDDAVLSAQSSNLDGAVLGPRSFLIRFFADDGYDRLLLINLGRDTHLSPAPEPLLAEPADCDWEVRWCSEDPHYGGLGVPPLQKDQHWFLPGNAAVLLAAVPKEKS